MSLLDKQSFHILQMIGVECSKEKEEIQYQQFCTYSYNDVLGVQVQDQYLYLVQPSKISVFEYHGKSKPLLIEEMIYNKVIKNYSINQHYICIQSQSLIQVRDRCYWVNLIYSHQITLQEGMGLFLQGHDLYISSNDNTEFSIKRINLQSKENLEIIHMGKVDQQKEQDFSFVKRPIFLKEMGAIQDFYIWGKDSKTVELGMLYVKHSNHKGKYEINQICLKEHFVFQVYHHTIKCLKYPRQSVEYAILVAQNLSQKKIVICFIQILPKNRHQGHIQGPGSSFSDLISQFSYLGKLDEKKKCNSLIDEMLSDVLTENYSKKTENQSYFEVKLTELKNYQESFIRDGKIWVTSQDTICEIVLKQEDSVQNLIKPSSNEEERIVQSIQYLSKNSDKRGIGIYKNNLLFSEQTISLLVRVPKEQNQSIAQEIIQSPDFQQGTLNQNIPKQTQDIEQLCNNIIECALQEREKQSKEVDEEQKTKRIMDIDSQVYSQNHFQKAKRDFETQTDPFINKSNQFQEIQLLVAKYSSAFNASCVKIKQNHFQKEKFEREILNIVDTMAKDIINPFLQQKFVSLLEVKIREISQNITVVLQSQLENLNESMRKIDIKEGHLRGKRIFEYSKQIQNIKGSVGEVVSSLKDKQINKFAFNELLLAQAEGLKEKVKDLQRQVLSITTKNEVAEAEINIQISEITELITKLCNKDESSQSEGSESEMDQSDNECSQGQERDDKSEDQRSQKQHDFQEQLNQEKASYHYYPHPQYYAHAHREHHMGKVIKANKKSDSLGYPTPGYPPQFIHPHLYPSPYYYPYGPHPVTPPFQPYFHPQVPLQPSYPPKPTSVKPKEKQKKRS